MASRGRDGHLRVVADHEHDVSWEEAQEAIASARRDLREVLEAHATAPSAGSARRWRPRWPWTRRAPHGGAERDREVSGGEDPLQWPPLAPPERLRDLVAEHAYYSARDHGDTEQVFGASGSLARYLAPTFRREALEVDRRGALYEAELKRIIASSPLRARAAVKLAHAQDARAARLDVQIEATRARVQRQREALAAAERRGDAPAGAVAATAVVAVALANVLGAASGSGVLLVNVVIAAAAATWTRLLGGVSREPALFDRSRYALWAMSSAGLGVVVVVASAAGAGLPTAAAAAAAAALVGWWVHLGEGTFREWRTRHLAARLADLVREREVIHRSALRARERALEVATEAHRAKVELSVLSEKLELLRVEHRARLEELMTLARDRFAAGLQDAHRTAGSGDRSRSRSSDDRS